MEDRARILVVDDETGMCDFLRYLLEGEGYEVDDANSGIEALDKLRAGSYHLVLADIKMPGMDGLEMLRRIKELDPDTIVIVMTGYSSLETAIKAIKYDAHNYLTKPFDDPDAVLAAVENGLLERRERLHK
ncbi:MAG: response regulator [Anaerolineae bacterium]|nr:response regulator [Anaerolineae bacterium]